MDGATRRGGGTSGSGAGPVAGAVQRDLALAYRQFLAGRLPRFSRDGSPSPLDSADAELARLGDALGAAVFPGAVGEALSRLLAESRRRGDSVLLQLEASVQATTQSPAVAAAFDEGGNFIDVRFGPLTQRAPATGVPYFDYRIRNVAAQSQAMNIGRNRTTTGNPIDVFLVTDRNGAAAPRVPNTTNVSVERGGHIPSVDFVVNRGFNETTGTLGGTTTGDTADRGYDTVYGLQVTVPIFSGGLTHSRVRQAEYRNIAARERLERTARETERATRDASSSRPSASSRPACAR